MNLNETKLFSIFEYALTMLNGSPLDEDIGNNNQLLNITDLEILLKLSNSIFINFKRIEIIKPFLVQLVAFYDKAPTFSNKKWLVFEFLCRLFCECDSLSSTTTSNSYENTFIKFYKTIFKYCIAYEKEKKPKLESMLNWIRKLIIKKEKSQCAAIVMGELEDEYVNILNSIDFESKQISEQAKRKLFELIFWLPKVSQYIFTKLAILILNKHFSSFIINHIFDIIKMKLDKCSTNRDESVNQSDYLIFLMTLFNGYTGFDLRNINRPSDYHQSNDFIIFDKTEKFKSHSKMCHHLEEFVKSHSNVDILIEVLLSSGLVTLQQKTLEGKIVLAVNTMNNLPSSTIYGLLTLISMINPKNELIYSKNKFIIPWLCNALFDLYFKSNSLRLQLINNNSTSTQHLICPINEQIECIDDLMHRIFEIYQNNDFVFMNTIKQISIMTFSSN
jgi:hypothetical protein